MGLKALLDQEVILWCISFMENNSKIFISKKDTPGPFFLNNILVAPKHLPQFYISTLSWCSNILQEPTVSSMIQNQIMFNNHYIRIDGKSLR